MKKNRKDIELRKQAGDGYLKDILRDDENVLSDLLDDVKEDRRASRRDFLKLCGFSFAVTALSSCRSKIGKAIPYVIAPVEITPGEALYYASSYINGNDYCSVVVKTREGRPIKIEGNPLSGITRGGTSTRIQASVLDLYDTGRFHGPIKDGKPVDWNSADSEIIGKLLKISENGKTIVLLTPTIFSPSTIAVIKEFLKKFKGSRWVEYDAISYSAMLEANKTSFDRQVIPDYRFDKADVVVNFGADFLGTWLSPVEYTRQFSSRRNPDQKMNYLVQLESNMSLTGSNADKRIMIKPSEEDAILKNIYKIIAKSVENLEIQAPVSPVTVNEITDKLLASRGKSILISGSNNLEIQLLLNEINRLLGNIGQTILFDSFLRTHGATDNNMKMLVSDMLKGEVGALLVWNVNPAYTWPDRTDFNNGLKKVGVTVSLSGSPDETSNLVTYVCPDNHYLESWNDAEAKNNMFSIMQPAIAPLFETRQATDTLLKWSGSTMTFYDFIKAYWTDNLMKKQTEFNNPTSFFDKLVERGVFEPSEISEKSYGINIRNKYSYNHNDAFNDLTGSGEGSQEIVLWESVAIGEGRQSNNPWLQELPDSVTKICWDNYASVSPAFARGNNLQDGEIVNISGIELPVLIQPGQAPGTIGIALGYGRTVCGKVGDGVGTDVWPLRSIDNNNIRNTRLVKDVTRTEKISLFARTQTHHSMEGRALARETVLDDYSRNPASGNELHAFLLEHDKSLYKERTYPHHHWGMAIDLSRCTGCANCVIACQAENNVPVVGKEEVHRVHEMHWIRIDRYFTGEEDNPAVLFQPVFCQHCQNAPCENVCPVAATNHSSEGLNQMIYNRCFGTRYCNNNCPYKVRRFNWFNYTEAGTIGGNLRDKEGMTGDLRRMVLNPDVTIRAQGVIEKCSFCIQRIQAGKLNAKKENRALYENEIQTACSQSCPARAIIFGDLNDPNGELSKLIGSGRRYNLLEELFTKPSVNYLTKVRNKTV